MANLFYSLSTFLLHSASAYTLSINYKWSIRVKGRCARKLIKVLTRLSLLIIATKTKKARRYKITVKKFRILENKIILYVYPYNYYIVKSKAITYIQKILIGVLKKIITNTSMIEQRNIIQEPTAERIIFFLRTLMYFQSIFHVRKNQFSL